MIQFLLNQQKVILDVGASSWPADMTVLDYLREEQNLCGTKEGCASGDCGACTVVVASLEQDTLRYQSINSCITFLGSLHGKQLITVEHLAGEDALHPVQQAMVDHHGSQCGFCTPGFGMSMFALYKTEYDEEDHQAAVHQYLAGNLCRCTGYRPIVDAAIDATKAPKPDQFSEVEQQTIEQLRAIVQNAEGNGFFVPTTITALSSQYLENPQAKLLSGGTDLALEVTQQLKKIDTIISLNRVVELQQVNRNAKQIEIGAAVSLAECDQVLKQYYPKLSELLHRFGSTQIRNQGTLGGNIANASPIGDLPPVLIALNARLVLHKDGVDREISIEAFFLGYKKTALQMGEFIRTIIVPLPTEQQQFFVYKISKRLDDDISAVCMAISVISKDKMVQSIRIALGGMAAIPERANHVETVLNGAVLNKQNIAAAKQALSKDFSPISDARASAVYRLQVAQNLLDRFYHEMTDPSVVTQVSHAR